MFSEEIEKFGEGFYVNWSSDVCAELGRARERSQSALRSSKLRVQGRVHPEPYGGRINLEIRESR